MSQYFLYYSSYVYIIPYSYYLCTSIMWVDGLLFDCCYFYYMFSSSEIILSYYISYSLFILFVLLYLLEGEVFIELLLLLLFYILYINIFF